jgi:hypothetical protein
MKLRGLADASRQVEPWSRLNNQPPNRPRLVRRRTPLKNTRYRLGHGERRSTDSSD